jgi:hypothetical protein
MDGFGPTQLIVNGDMRANANFDFLNGSPTVNGSVYAAVNDKLTPAATGLINTGPVKSTNAVYTAAQAADRRMRQAYTASLAGTKGSETYEKWRDFVFDSEGSIVSGRYAGAVLADSTGYRGWTRTSSGATAATTTLDTTPTKEIIMPDLSDLDYYQNLSSTYVNEKATFADGTANPEAGKGAYLEVWDATLAGGAGAYKRLDTNGNVSGSVMVVGSSTRPIKIHGPVTVSQDVVIKGVVQGQGTLYAGRNVHIVGSVTYKDEPDFRGTNLQTIDNANEKKDFLGLAARASVVFGNPKTFADPYPLKYMKPPFTKARVDEAGNTIPAYNATEVDGTGKKKYQSTFGDDALHAIASGINQVDAIVYTNFVGGGNLGTGGGGVKFNGTIISRDEAMVIWSLPVTQNYDNRIRERFPVRKPLIDLMLPEVRPCFEAPGKTTDSVLETTNMRFNTKKILWIGVLAMGLVGPGIAWHKDRPSDLPAPPESTEAELQAQQVMNQSIQEVGEVPKRSEEQAQIERAETSNSAASNVASVAGADGRDTIAKASKVHNVKKKGPAYWLIALIGGLACSAIFYLRSYASRNMPNYDVKPENHPGLINKKNIEIK